nr:MAG TPA: Single strand binding protein [Caudoviricetes sp.]
MNSVNLIGRLCADPEARMTQSGVKVCKLRLAVQRDFKNQDGDYEADFINCAAWRSTADFIEKYFRKGQGIGVTGKLQTSSWEDESGNKRYATEVIVENATFTEALRETVQQAQQNPPAGFAVTDEEDDDLPF